jgi:hypothetical protein
MKWSRFQMVRLIGIFCVEKGNKTIFIFINSSSLVEVLSSKRSGFQMLKIIPSILDFFLNKNKL